MRELILSEIRRLAEANGGQAPGQMYFARETNIAAHQWRGRLWARWGDALIEAGFQPNAWTKRLDADSIVTSLVAACRHFGKFPTFDEMMIYRKIDSALPPKNTILNHFGSRENLIAELTKLAQARGDLADIFALLPKLAREKIVVLGRSEKVSDGSVYLIQSGEFYKVGRSDDIERRVKEIRIALPARANLIHAIRTDDPSGIEAYWHQRFKEKRANGEWFKLDSADVAAFKKRKYQ